MTSRGLSILFLVCCLSWKASAFFNINRGVTCDEFEVEHGDHSPRAPFFVWKHKVFTVITFTCDDGYALVGERTSECMINGEWSQKSKCVEIEGLEKARVACQIPPLGDNVQVFPQKRSYGLGESVTFVCPGVRKAHSSGYTTTQCGEDNQFHPAPPKCIEPRCTPPESPVKGGIRPNNPSYAVGEVVEFKCAEGYEVVGDKKTTCGADGYFPATETVCKISERSELATCERPQVRYQQTIQHDKDEYFEGEQIMFSCGFGYELKGENIAKCESTGKWSIPSPKCKPILCAMPAIPEHVNIVYKKKTAYRAGQVAMFYCDRGYVMNGRSQCMCRRNGQFYPKPPTCEKSYYH